MAANGEPAVIELQVRPPTDDRELLLHRIRDLEMDNEILKQQLIFVTAEMRQSFMELAEKIDLVDSKLSPTLGDATTIVPATKHITTSSGNADSQKFDALACVETVMETSQIISNSSIEVKEEPWNIEEPVGGGSAAGSPGRPPVEAVPLETNVFASTTEVDFNNNEVGSRNEIGTPPKRYCCTICNKTFCQGSGLSRHQKIHLKQQQSSFLGLDVDKIVKPKRFFCTAPNCKSGFTSRSGMTKHAKNFHRDPSIKPLIIPLVDLQPSTSAAFLVPAEPLMDLNCPAEDVVRIDNYVEKPVDADKNEDMDETV